MHGCTEFRREPTHRPGLSGLGSAEVGMASRVRSVSGATVVGPRHVRAGRGNEDALGWRSFDGRQGLRTVAAVADGHGSNLCPRSERGANLAVQAAVLAAEEVITSVTDGEAEMASMMVRRTLSMWHSAVDRDLTHRPLSPEQLHRIGAHGDGDERMAYGCTLLVCAVTDESVMLGQVGDGEIAAVREDGAGWFPLGPNPNPVPGSSDSLCLPGADDRARTAVLQDEQPALMMLMTDGCTNAYNTADELLTVGADTIRLEQSTGLRRANLTLESWLGSTAERTEDDATLVAVWM